MTLTDPAALTDLLHERFGFTAFLPGQRAVIAALVERGAALAVFPTGATANPTLTIAALSLRSAGSVKAALSQ